MIYLVIKTVVVICTEKYNAPHCREIVHLPATQLLNEDLSLSHDIYFFFMERNFAKKINKTDQRCKKRLYMNYLSSLIICILSKVFPEKNNNFYAFSKIFPVKLIK